MTVLAQVDPTKVIADGLSGGTLTQALGYACALLIIFIGLLLRAYLAQGTEHRAELARRDEAKDAATKAHADAVEKLSADRLVDMKADAKEQREILSQIVPLAAKLTEGLEILERLTLSKE